MSMRDPICLVGGSDPAGQLPELEERPASPDVFHRRHMSAQPEEHIDMQGYVARKGDRYYAVIYEGLDPVTGKERRSWHPAGTDRAEA